MLDNISKIVCGFKVDLDIIGALWLLAFRFDVKADAIEFVFGDAKAEDLSDPTVVCIECGGSGRVDLMNFDHHGEGSEGLVSATWQAYDKYKPVGVYTEDTQRIVKYIDTMDRFGPDEIRKYSIGEPPFLSDIISGIFLVNPKDNAKKVEEGILFLDDISRSGIDPFGSMKLLVDENEHYVQFVDAHAENKRQVQKVVEKATWGKTKSGLIIASVESGFFGTIGALYENGAQVVVAVNPNFQGIRKFTVAGNKGISVAPAADDISKVESGWGGPPSGTIIGSNQKKDSELDLELVTRIVVSAI